MRIYDGTHYRDLTTEELAEIRKAEALYKIQERSRPLTEGEVLSMLLSQKMQEISVDDNTALRMMAFYPTFDSVIGQTVKQGFKFTHADKLWRVVQSELTIQAHYPPSVGTESLYEEICETHDGTLEDPIPYSGNMELTEGKYYMQDYVIYYCTRSSGIAMQHQLAELVGLYVKEV